ncbi:MAG: type II secretion system protein GspL [Litorilituus sp.]|jgi:general secretion pathway protein L|nr:type II secretion system protein GspL [Litorilituus sp.]
MAEILYIRLGSDANDEISWLIYSPTEQEIIASGVLHRAQQLVELTEKAAQRVVKVFVPGCDVSLKSLTVPTKSQRALHSAVPYMLEDELAQDVEQLFFAYADLNEDEFGHNCFVAVVENTQMQAWQTWLKDADIKTKSMQLDVLAMPLIANQWSAIALNNTDKSQIIVRQGQWQGCTLDAATWRFASQHLFNGKTQAHTDAKSPIENQHLVINAYSALPHAEQLVIHPQEEELPLALLAQHSQKSDFNLLQGKFKTNEVHSKAFKHWLWAAGFAACALLLNISYKSAQLWQFNAQQAHVEAQIISTYKKAFPQTKKVRIGTIKSQLKKKIAGFGAVGSGEGFLAMLSKVQPAFAKVPELKPESLKFDSKRQELRLQAIAREYQHFERFKNALNDAKLTVKQGAQNSQGEQITGSFSVTSSASNHSKRSTKGRS